jgi:hypothetical protein
MISNNGFIKKTSLKLYVEITLAVDKRIRL